MNSSQWQTIKNFTPGDFNHPDKIELSIVSALDKFTTLIGVKPDVLSDVRDLDPARPGSQHPKGTAVDVYFPGLDSMRVLDDAEQSGLFDGIGLYVNERGVISFHFDTRGERARWGALITPGTSQSGAPVRNYEYTTLDRVIEFVKKKPEVIAGAGIAVLLFLALLLIPKR